MSDRIVLYPCWMKNEKNFWAAFDRRDDGCWVWIGRANQDGYGQVYYGGKSQRVPRVAYLLAKGSIPGGLLVCHSCDVRLCGNPDHLWLGTAKDNAMDAVKKGRMVIPYYPGGLHPLAKLCDDERAQVVIDRGTGLSIRALGAKYGISTTSVQHILFPEKQKKKWAARKHGRSLGLRK